MSHENVEIARRTFGPDPTAFYELLDEDVELDARAIELPGAVALARGREVVERFTREFWGTWDDYRAEPTDFLAIGDEVVVDVSESGRGRGSGVPFARTHVQVWTFRDGRVVRWRLFVDKAEALAAAGAAP
jgi:ketosteroid isomerase-like protein